LSGAHSPSRPCVRDRVSGESWIEKLWNAGEQLLVHGQYCAARRELEAAEAAAFQRRNAALLTRIYLPLLETCRQVRQLSTDGLISLQVHAPDHRSARSELKRFAAHGGGVLISGSAKLACTLARRARLAGCPVECLLLVRKGDRTHITHPLDAQLISGLPVVWRPAHDAETLPEPPEKMCVALPPPGDYVAGMAGHSSTTESILLLYEALALRQIRRRQLPSDGWPLMASLRKIRLIDMACEPVTIRLLREAEKLSTHNR
jgi:hypothetical protein